MTRSSSWTNEATLKQARTECELIKRCQMPVTISELSDVTGIPRPTVNHAVNRLIKSDVLCRLPGHRISITSKEINNESF